jgi:hypothetical protein
VASKIAATYIATNFQAFPGSNLSFATFLHGTFYLANSLEKLAAKLLPPDLQRMMGMVVNDSDK